MPRRTSWGRLIGATSRRGANGGAGFNARSSLGLGLYGSRRKPSSFVQVGNAPVNTVLPAVTPTTNIILGTVLTTNNGTWNNTPTSFLYQWLDDGVPIAGATATTYTVVAGDNGSMLSCQVTAVNASGSAAAVSNAVGPALTLVPVNTVAPVQSPTSGVVIGTVETVTTGTWSNSPSSYRYQWRRGSSDIAGATTNSYTIAVADHSQLISCRVWASNAVGESITFVVTTGVTPNLIPANSVLPAVTPTTGIVESTLLTTTNGTWSNSPSGYTYQWLRDGTSITGATSQTYSVVTHDNGKLLSCQVTATNAQGSATATSNSVGPAITALAVYAEGVYVPGVYE